MSAPATPNPFLSATVVTGEQLFAGMPRPEIHNETLGLHHVELADSVAKYIIETTPRSSEQRTEFATTRLGFKFDLRHALHDMRTEIKGIDPEQRAAYGRAVFESMPTLQQDGLYERIRDSGFDYGAALDWLLERPTGDLRGVSQSAGDEFSLKRDDYDQRLLNFLQSHADRIKRRQQRPEFQKAVELHKTFWLQALQDGIDEGWLDDSARERMEELDEVTVYEGDKFSTILQTMYGFHVAGTQEIVVAPHTGAGVTFHELNHAVLDGDDYDEKGLRFVGYPTGNKDEQCEMMEAITEHAALVMNGALADVEEATSERGAYPEERKKHLYEPVAKAKELGIHLTIADFTRFYSATGDDRIALGQKLAVKIAQVEDATILADVEQVA